MIKLKKIIFLLLFLVSNVFSQTLGPEDLMNTANNLYQSGNYEEALKTYEQILSMGIVSSSLYYNLGNAYFKNENLGKAILSYERGLKLKPNDEDLTYNLKLVKARTIDKIQNVPQIFIVEWWVSLITLFTLEGWTYIVSIMYISVLIFLGIFVLSKKSNLKRKSFYISIFGVLLLILSSVLMYSNITREVSSESGVVLKKVISVKVSPNENSGDAFILHEGVKFSIESRLNEWVEIKLVDGKIGWLRESGFETI